MNTQQFELAKLVKWPYFLRNKSSQNKSDFLTLTDNLAFVFCSEEWQDSKNAAETALLTACFLTAEVCFGNQTYSEVLQKIKKDIDNFVEKNITVKTKKGILKKQIFEYATFLLYLKNGDLFNKDFYKELLVQLDMTEEEYQKHYELFKDTLNTSPLYDKLPKQVCLIETEFSKKQMSNFINWSVLTKDKGLVKLFLSRLVTKNNINKFID